MEIRQRLYELETLLPDKDFIRISKSQIANIEIIQFSVWMRNGIAFCITWLLLLLLVYTHIFNIQTISTNILERLVFWIVGGVFIFNLIFTRLIIKKWNFTGRLTCFMVLISLYECLGFYWLGFFEGKGSAVQWTAFIGIIFILYFICMAIYQKYSKKKGEIYTQVLREYQSKRSIQNEK